MSGIYNGNPEPNFRPENQLNFFFDVNLDVSLNLKGAMRESLRRSPLSRAQIIDKVNELAAVAGFTTNGKCQKVTEAMLNKWLAPSHPSCLVPVRYLVIFCMAVESCLPLTALTAAILGISIVNNHDKQILCWGQAELNLRKAKSKARRLLQNIEDADEGF